jgi:hypothetical protein
MQIKFTTQPILKINIRYKNIFFPVFNRRTKLQTIGNQINDGKRFTVLFLVSPLNFTAIHLLFSKFHFIPENIKKQLK